MTRNSGPSIVLLSIELVLVVAMEGVELEEDCGLVELRHLGMRVERQLVEVLEMAGRQVPLEDDNLVLLWVLTLMSEELGLLIREPLLEMELLLNMKVFVDSDGS